VTRAAAAILAFALLAVAGCGEKRETTTGGAPASGSAPAAVTVSETEFKLDPASVEVAEGKVTVEVKNEGGTEHALEIEGPGGEVKTPTLAPGKSVTLDADLKAGTYEMYCPIDGHKGKGMEGELVVGGGGGTSTDDSGGSDDDGGGSSGGSGGY
jgi:uncharacterized cupredoxin-like copper-binding protein